MSQQDQVEAARVRAEARFKKQQGTETAAQEGRRIADAEKVAEAEKTARLRALRLAKEQSDRIAAEVRKARRQR